MFISSRIEYQPTISSNSKNSNSKNNNSKKNNSQFVTTLRTYNVQYIHLHMYYITYIDLMGKRTVRDAPRTVQKNSLYKILIGNLPPINGKSLIYHIYFRI